MKLLFERRGRYLLVKAEGRLDANWADYVSESLAEKIREGEQDLIIDASEMVFLSSAGIRTLLTVYKALRSVSGSFLICRSTEFVVHTLTTSGFGDWLSESFPSDMPGEDTGEKDAGHEKFLLDARAYMSEDMRLGWKPWQAVAPGQPQAVVFPEDVIGLGIGSASGESETARERYGEFLAVSGHVVFQPPAEDSRADYLILENQFTPDLECIQALTFHGRMSHLIRFSPTQDKPFFNYSDLLETVLEDTGSDTAVFTAVAEIEGLVGARLIKSPGQLEPEEEMAYPKVKDWLDFCGERSYSDHLAVLVGAVSRRNRENDELLTPCKAIPGVQAHVHAAVFPYQPLQNGRIDLEQTVKKIFSGPPPVTVMHLINDDRLGAGLGQSAFVRGALWFAPVRGKESGK